MREEVAANLESDVLVVGAGIAGLTAAIRAAEGGARVTIISKGPVAGDGAASWMAGWGFQAALYPPDSPEAHARDTIRIGQYLNDQELLLTLINEIPHCLRLLDRWGMRYLKSDGKYVQVRLPGASHARVPRLSRKGVEGGPEYRRLFPRQLRRAGVRAISNLQALELLKYDGVVVGVLALDTVEGNFVAIRAKVTILATGGLMGMYRFTTTSPTLTGEGQAMAYQAGAQLQDIEFADFYTSTIVWPPFFAGDINWPTVLRFELSGKYYNSEGEEFLKNRRGSPLALPVLVQQEIAAGRCSPHGGVYLSFKHLLDTTIEDSLASMGRTRPVRALEALGIDIRQDALEVAPAPMESLGGCRIDSRCQTNVPGLLAAGEVAGGAEGAYTLAGNPMALYTAMGSIAGQQAASLIRGTDGVPDVLPDLRPSLEAALRPLGNRVPGAVPVLEVRKELEKVLKDHLHLLGRSEQTLTKAIGKILAIQKDAERWQVRTSTRRFNSEWIGALELRHMATVCEMLARAALARKESRGLHYREDFPESSPDWLCNLLVQKDGEEMKVSKAPVSFPFVLPGER